MSHEPTPEPITVNVVRLPHAVDLDLPAYQTAGAAGMDLIAAVRAGLPLTLDGTDGPSNRLLVPTGLILELPAGYEAQVRPRSGLALKHGVTVLNAPGTIDSDYRGEVQVLLINHGRLPFEVSRGLRIAQLVIAPVSRAKLVEAAMATETQRGTGGFGSTGVEPPKKSM
jgi:dUTP pyrophosphatase